MRLHDCLLFIVFVPYLSFSTYINFEIFADPNCSISSFRSQWIFSNSTYCKMNPFSLQRYGEENLFVTFDLLGDQVSIIFFEESNCSEYHDQVTIDTKTCQSFEIGLSTFTVNLSLISDLPFLKQDSLEYYGQRNFQTKNNDSSCTYPVDGTILQDGSSSTIKRLDSTKIGKILDDRQLYYCTKDWLAVEFRNILNATLIDGWKYLSYASSGDCLENYVETLVPDHEEFAMIIPECMDFKEANEKYLSKIPKEQQPSELKILKLSFYYDKDCSEGSSYHIKPWYLGTCNHQNTQTVSLSSNYTLGIVETTYYDSFCNEDSTVYFSRIEKQSSFSPPYYDECMFKQDDNLVFGVQNFMKRELVENINFLGWISIIKTPFYNCDSGDKDIHNLKRNLGVRGYVSLNSPHRCQPKSKEMDWGESYDGKCVSGNPYYKIYNNSEFCFGDYQNIVYERECTESESVFKKMYFHYTCLSNICGLYNEHDEDVCHSHGKCIAFDNCACDNGYEGEFCDYWHCYGVMFNDSEVCNDKGRCIEPDTCLCEWGNDGDNCEYYTALTVLFVFIGIVSQIVLFILCLACVIIFWSVCCCGIFLIWGFSVLLKSCLILLAQRTKLGKFEKLKDFDILLHEQLMEKGDTSRHHLKIDKKLFEIHYDEIKVDKMIGSGGSGAKVFLAFWKDQKVAFKCFQTRGICSSQDRFDLFAGEVNLLATISHPNIIRFFGATLSPPRVGIIMEYCENGELVDFFKKVREEQSKEYPLEEKLRMCREIISSLDYLHSRNIFHRDLKSENILVDYVESTKLMDFGISKVIVSLEGEKTKRIGTNCYMAPEILTGNYDNKADVFSFSMVLYTIFAENNYPYFYYEIGEKKIYQIEFRVANDPNFRPHIQSLEIFKMKKYEWVLEVMKTCWCHNPTKRYSFNEIGDIFEEKMGLKDTDKEDMTNISSDRYTIVEEDKQEIVRRMSNQVYGFRDKYTLSEEHKNLLDNLIQIL